MNEGRPVKVADAMRSSTVSIGEGVTLPNVLEAMESSHLAELPAVAPDGLFRGMVERRAVERLLYDRGQEAATAGEVAEDPLVQTSPEASIDTAIDKMLADELATIPVLSADDRLVGVLVLDDLRGVPDLVEEVIERRRLHETAAQAGVTKVMIGCSLASAALGLFLFALWIDGPYYGLPRWLSWVDGVAALLAFIGAVSASSREMFAVPLWSVAGLGLCFAAALGHAWRDNASATWLQLGVAVTFFAMAAVVGAPVPRRPHAGALQSTRATTP